MNGRIYDPVLGRFLSPDPFIQAPFNSQNYNRYTYVLNNPLTLTDPSGFLFGFDDFAFWIANILFPSAVATAVDNIQYQLQQNALQTALPNGTATGAFSNGSGNGLGFDRDPGVLYETQASREQEGLKKVASSKEVEDRDAATSSPASNDEFSDRAKQFIENEEIRKVLRLAIVETTSRMTKVATPPGSLEMDVRRLRPTGTLITEDTFMFIRTGSFNFETGQHVFEGNQTAGEYGRFGVVPIDLEGAFGVVLVIPRGFPDVNLTNVRGRFGDVPVVVVHETRTFLIENMVGPIEFDL